MSSGIVTEVTDAIEYVNANTSTSACVTTRSVDPLTNGASPQSIGQNWLLNPSLLWDVDKTLNATPLPSSIATPGIRYPETTPHTPGEQSSNDSWLPEFPLSFHHEESSNSAENGAGVHNIFYPSGFPDDQRAAETANWRGLLSPFGLKGANASRSEGCREVRIPFDNPSQLPLVCDILEFL